MGEPHVSIIILNWNQKLVTAACLRSLEKITYKNYRVIVVDNGSGDDSVAYLRQNFPSAVILANVENVGFAEGCNVGMRRACEEGTDYAFLVNNDVTVEPNALEVLVSTAEADRTIGIVGAVNYALDDPGKPLIIGTNFNWLSGYARRENLKPIESGRIRDPQPIDGASGSALLIKRPVIDRIGLLDARFFIYYEDVDWCLRARRAGYRVLYVPQAKVYHEIGTTFGKNDAVLCYLYTRNLPLFMVKNSPRLLLANFFVFYVLKILFRIVLYFLTGRRRRLQALLYGVRDFLKNNFGKGSLQKFL